jgi:hypothetical protein
MFLFAGQIYGIKFRIQNPGFNIHKEWRTGWGGRNLFVLSALSVAAVKF